MTTEGLTTMVIAWTVILSLAGYFLLKVIRTPQDKDKQQEKE